MTGEIYFSFIGKTKKPIELFVWNVKIFAYIVCNGHNIDLNWRLKILEMRKSTISTFVNDLCLKSQKFLSIHDIMYANIFISKKIP
jgi:hypothetical protein